MKGSIVRRIKTLLLLSSLALSLPLQAGLISTGGAVTVDVLHSSSGFTNHIWLFHDDADLTAQQFIGYDNHPDTVHLGPIAAGKELIFGIKGPQGTFYTGDPLRNADKIVHAKMSYSAETHSWLIGFEDLLGGGDLDFNDAYIRVHQAVVVPEPSTLTLLAIGIVALLIYRRSIRST